MSQLLSTRHSIDPLIEALARSRGPSVVSLPAPVVPLAHAIGTLDGEVSLIAESDEHYDLGLGASRRLCASGPRRFDAIRAQARRLFAELDVDALRQSHAEPRLFGGFAFQPGSAAREPWTAFGDAEFVLPRIHYRCQGRQASLSLSVAAGEVRQRERLERLVQELRAFEQRLRRAPEQFEAKPPRLQARADLDAGAWDELIQPIKRGIAAGRLIKVVLARRRSLGFSDAIDPRAVLRELWRNAQGTTLFALARSGDWFIGATPERLVKLSGRELSTAALAGTLDARLPESQLMLSQKDRLEHRLVVDAIQAALRPLASEVVVPDTPEYCHQASLIHLKTPIHARLAGPRHVLELVERLHPTPAMAGVPRDAAIELILAGEATPRGWYSGPVGWFDGSGDGEFVVAIRCGLLRGRSAELYSGAGIVEHSESAAEYAETDLKFLPLTRALTLVQ